MSTTPSSSKRPWSFVSLFTSVCHPHTPDPPLDPPIPLKKNGFMGQQLPGVGVVLSQHAMARAYCLHLAGILPFLPLRQALGRDCSHVILNVPLMPRQPCASPRHLRLKDRSLCHIVGCYARRLFYRMLWMPSLFNHLAGRGVPTFVYVANNPRTIPVLGLEPGPPLHQCFHFQFKNFVQPFWFGILLGIQY